MGDIINKKILVKYILLYIPVCIGICLFMFGIVNLFSSLLLFIGGYIAIKNTLDYRLVRKNINNSKNVEIVPNRDNMTNREYVCHNNIVGLKRIRRYSRVRRKY